MKNRANREFEQHWLKNQQHEIPPCKLEQAQQFLDPLTVALNASNLASGKLLDAGCGNGVHIELLQTLLPTWHKIGVDIAFKALVASQQRKGAEQWSFAQANIDNLCLPNNSIDAIICYGVLAYTSNPQATFSELCRILKPGALIALWLYPQPRGLAKLALFATRGLCRFGGPFIANLLANSLVPFLGFLPTVSKASLKNCSWAECREVILVNIAPQSLHFYTKDTLLQWFQENQIEVIYDASENPITLYGRKI